MQRAQDEQDAELKREQIMLKREERMQQIFPPEPPEPPKPPKPEIKTK